MNKTDQERYLPPLFPSKQTQADLKMNYDRQRILVTGGTGFTGGKLCKRLAEQGYAVRALVRDKDRAGELTRCGVELAIGDLRDRTALERAVEGVETVYHIAALFRAENVSNRDMWETNVEGTRNMLDASIKSGVKRFVHCSTVGVHGHIKNSLATEDAPFGPGDYYQESKAVGEKVALQYMSENRLPIVVFRPAGIYGPGDLRFLKLFRAIKHRRFIMLGTGEVCYHFTYIDDLLDGILLCGTKEEALGNVFILGGEKPVTLNQLVKEIAEVTKVQSPKLRFPVMPVYYAGFVCELLCKPLGIHPPLYRRRVDWFRKNRAFCIDKARRQLGFQPKVDLKTGLKYMADWYRQNNYI